VGLTLSVGFFIIALLQCGVPCAGDIAVVTTACISTGILTVGPIGFFFFRPLMAVDRIALAESHRLSGGSLIFISPALNLSRQAISDSFP